MTILTTIILGIVEGISEFLPISSTAHLLLVEKLFRIPESLTQQTFTIAIQLGAIFAVVALFGIKRFFTKDMFPKLVIGFIPTALVGFLLYPLIKSLLTGNLLLLAATLGIGGILLLFANKSEQKTIGTKAIGLKDAFLLGIFQAFAVIPGVSRSGGMLIGGLFAKYERSALVDFTFLLAVPTIAAATLYDLWKVKDSLTSSGIGAILLGAIVSFAVAYASAQWFIKFAKTRGLAIFGYYRIALAIILLIIFFI